MMNDNSKSRLPTGLICLLIFQWVLVLVSLGYSVAGTLALGFHPDFSSEDASIVESFLFSCVPLVLAGWGLAMGYASIGIVRRSSQGFRIGMICHLLLGVVGWAFVLILVGSWALIRTHSGGQEGMEGLFLLFAFMWLPILLPSAWAFFYLRRLRKSQFA
jgi:hypothetical protein